MVTEKLCRPRADVPWEQGSGTSWASSDEHLPK